MVMHGEKGKKRKGNRTTEENQLSRKNITMGKEYTSYNKQGEKLKTKEGRKEEKERKIKSKQEGMQGENETEG